MNQDILHEIINQDYKIIADRIQEGLKQKISDSNSKGVIFGLSGGIDSAVIAYLCHNAIKEKTRLEWEELMEGTDVCFAPVLSMDEAYEHPHNKERGTFIEIAGVMQPAPAPRFSRTPGSVPSPPPHAGENTEEVLSGLGLTTDEILMLREQNIIK